MTTILNIVDALTKLLEDNKNSLQYQHLFLGMQDLIPGTPTIIITFDKKQKAISGAPQFRAEYTFRFTIFACRVTQDESNYRDAIEIGEAVELLLDSNSHLRQSDGSTLITFGMVTLSEQGIAVKESSRTIYRTVTLTYDCEVYSIMPNPTN